MSFFMRSGAIGPGPNFSLCPAETPVLRQHPWKFGEHAGTTSHAVILTYDDMCSGIGQSSRRASLRDCTDGEWM